MNHTKLAGLVASLFVVFLVAAAACSKFAPPPEDLKGYPCGDPRMIWCNQQEGTCCWDGEVCGGAQGMGDMGCQKDMCCWRGPWNVGAKQDGGAEQSPPSHPQTKARRAR